ncbi:DUF6473 family protein [Jannaschia sp. 2305UL9-9]|uniref:DUF6473 family protein n=1 Tax=Jannaschia sp. 2305UL9-9 TaxID=3121638 RepID=UPI0035298813
MSYDRHETDLDYYLCGYGASRITFRGPAISLDRAYTAVIGGSETFGRYVEDPFCDRIADMTGRFVANMGVINGSVDAFTQDEGTMAVLLAADTVVIQVTGAANISNRFYSVHPRRNDRFLRHSILMETLFQNVDFSDFSFTRHMLSVLQDSSPEKFAIIQQELREAWVARMRLLLTRLPGRKILLWIEGVAQSPLGEEPLFVTVDMMQKLEPLIDKLVHCDVSSTQSADQLDDMIFPEIDAASARLSLSSKGHERVAHALARAIGRPDGLSSPVRQAERRARAW